MAHNIEKKLRVQLFSPEFDMVGDRLVNQDTEFRKGPPEVHEGPIKMEVCLFSQADIPELIEYLNKISGCIPLDEKVPKKRNKLTITPENLRLEIIQELKQCSNPREFQEAMQDFSFMAISLDLLIDLEYPVKIGDVHEEFTFWVKRVKKAKNPINHKYDVSLLVGILGKKVVVYDGTEVIENFTLESDDKKLQKIPKYIKLKFPHYVAQDERNRLRFEIEALTEDEDLEPTKFYKRWAWDIQKVNEKIQIPRLDSIDNPYK